MFNADLALSVTMTAISTLLSVVMLPVNLIIYASTSYSSAVVKSLDWAALFHSLVTVIGAIAVGLICSATVSSRKFNLFANKVSYIYCILKHCHITCVTFTSDVAHARFSHPFLHS
jgi:predicted Na+-dependent transporter